MVVLRGRRPDIHRLRTCQASDRETSNQSTIRRLSLSISGNVEPFVEQTSIPPVGSPGDTRVNSVDNQESFNPEPQTYTSLPPSPVSLSPPPLHRNGSKHQRILTAPPFSLWDYLREELLATDFDSHQELKWERVSNFLSIPLAIEKVCR